MEYASTRSKSLTVSRQPIGVMVASAPPRRSQSKRRSNTSVETTTLVSNTARVVHRTTSGSAGAALSRLPPGPRDGTGHVLIGDAEFGQFATHGVC
jgi:hypothetical protein